MHHPQAHTSHLVVHTRNPIVVTHPLAVVIRLLAQAIQLIVQKLTLRIRIQHHIPTVITTLRKLKHTHLYTPTTGQQTTTTPEVTTHQHS